MSEFVLQFLVQGVVVVDPYVLTLCICSVCNTIIVKTCFELLKKESSPKQVECRGFKGRRWKHKHCQKQFYDVKLDLSN